MRQFAALACLACLIAPALAAEPERPRVPSAGQAAARRSTLDDLFERLAAARDEAEAKGIAQLIERRLGRSASDTANLLMTRAEAALRDRDFPLAVELLDRVTTLQPGWAEAWSRRATAFYLLDDPIGAMNDLRQALTREPRHYEAWGALGHLALAAGDKKLALEAYRHALKLHPFLESVRNAVERLTPEIDGRDL
jgi:tetratricopeptide (TPR) repeat protein